MLFKYPFQWALASLGVLVTQGLPFSALAQAVRVDSFMWRLDDQVEIVFFDDTSGISGDYSVEGASSLVADEWASVSTTPITSREGNQWSFSVLASEGPPARFFRVLKSGIPLTTGFANPTGTIAEGTTDAGVWVFFSDPFAGTLHYSINVGGEAGIVTGEISLNGESSARIPLNQFQDDLIADALTYLSLRLQATDGAGEEVRFDQGTTTILVEDNDANWAGILDSHADAVDILFRVRTAKQGVTDQAWLKTDTAGYFPANVAEDGNWPFSSLVKSATEFSGTVGPIIVPPTATVYDAATHLTLHLTTDGGGSVNDDRIEGTYTLATTVPALPHLAPPPRTGTFLLLREVAPVPESLAPIDAP